MIFLQKILTNIKNIKKYAVDVTIWQDKTESLEKLLEGKNNLNTAIAFEEKMLNKQSFFFSNDKQRNILYCLGTYIKWQYSTAQDGMLEGGFAFRSILDVITSSDFFWEDSLSLYKNYEYIQANQEKFIRELRWFEAYEYPDQNSIIDTYGCIIYNPPNFPNQFYFYSNGIAYLLPFSNFENYIDAMLMVCGIKYWQYFYIEPEILIQQNKDKTYITHNLTIQSRLNAFQGYTNRYNYIKDLGIDRLDLINECLERNIRLLPKIFPFADFTHHQNYYKRFKELYDAAKKE